MPERSRRHVVPPSGAPLPGTDPGTWLHLSSSGWHAKLIDVMFEPPLLALVAADTAWAFGVQDWAARRPPRRRPIAYLKWRAEEIQLASEQVRLVAAALQQRAPLIR